MIHELQRTAGIALAIECKFPEAQAVIEGNNPGWVFVDDLHAPRAALVWAGGMQGFYLVGDSASTVFLEELDAFTDRVLEPRLHDLEIDWFEISGDEDWNPVIEAVFARRLPESSQQLVYTLKPSKYGVVTRPEAMGDLTLLRVDQRLLADLPVSNKGFLFSKLIQFWGSLEAFSNAGFGYVLMAGGEIASLCFSAFVAGNVHAIDVETIASQRRKGYAEIVARAFIAECIEKRLQPHWDCMAENTASAQLVEKLGFTQSYTYILYSFALQS